LEKYGLPDTVLLRSNDTGLYMTSDLGLTVHKFEKYKVDKSLWIVSSQQSLHFKQLFKIVEILGYPWSEKCFHVQFEHVVLPEGKMSSREGRAVMLDEVVASLIKSAYNEVNKRGSKLNKKEKMKLAKKIGIGAIKYAILKIEPNDSIVFDWKQMLRFEGNNAPYLQYAHTRCAGILRKAERWNHVFFPSKLEGTEKELVRKLFEFRRVVENSTKDFKPNYICNYIYGLATAFDKFYEFCPVLKADEKTKNFRLTLVEATKIVLGNALNLVGIDALEKM
jgi:arginyl-tRNA synthetase